MNLGTEYKLPEHCQEVAMCSFNGCNKKAVAKNLCAGHYSQLRSGKPLTEIRRVFIKDQICLIEDCQLAARVKGLCNAHWSRLYKYGDPLHIPQPQISKWKDQVCIFEDCGRSVHAVGLCITHCRQQWMGQELKPISKQVRSANNECKVDGCANKHKAGGYCQNHYSRIKRNGNLDRPSKLGCSNCGQSFTVFNGGPIPELCNDCRIEKHRIQSRNRSMKRRVAKYGITETDYFEMLQIQNFVCAICGKPETRGHGAKLGLLCIDHNHLNGAVRGLLCTLCNCILGYAHDDKKILLAAVEYLEAAE